MSLIQGPFSMRLQAQELGGALHNLAEPIQPYRNSRVVVRCFVFHISLLNCYSALASHTDQYIYEHNAMHKIFPIIIIYVRHIAYTSTHNIIQYFSMT